MREHVRFALLRFFRRYARPVLGPGMLWMNTAGSHGYHRARPADVPVTAYCVYRSTNADAVSTLIDGLPSGSLVHLHALDRVAPILDQFTREIGPGARIPLLQNLLDKYPPVLEQHVVIADDDVTFIGTGARRFPGLGVLAEFDICQPAHTPDSEHSFRVTRAEPLSTARETTFVEVGPVVLLSPKAQALVLPFPEDAQMGWGLDVQWSGLRRNGLRLGVIDATPVHHFGRVAADYDTGPEAEVNARYLREAEVASVHDLAHNTGRTWRPWQRAPRWTGER